MNKKNENSARINDFSLLSHKYRIVGIILFCLSVTALLLHNYYNDCRAIFDLRKGPQRMVALSNCIALGLLLSLFIIAATFEKDEDEIYQPLRLKALKYTIVMSFLSAVSTTAYKVLLNRNAWNYTFSDMFLMLLLFYLIIFHASKSGH